MEDAKAMIGLPFIHIKSGGVYEVTNIVRNKTTDKLGVLYKSLGKDNNICFCEITIPNIR